MSSRSNTPFKEQSNPDILEDVDDHADVEEDLFQIRPPTQKVRTKQGHRYDRERHHRRERHHASSHKSSIEHQQHSRHHHAHTRPDRHHATSSYSTASKHRRAAPPTESFHQSATAFHDQQHTSADLVSNAGMSGASRGSHYGTGMRSPGAERRRDRLLQSVYTSHASASSGWQSRENSYRHHYREHRSHAVESVDDEQVRSYRKSQKYNEIRSTKRREPRHHKKYGGSKRYRRNRSVSQSPPVPLMDTMAFSLRNSAIIDRTLEDSKSPEYTKRKRIGREVSAGSRSLSSSSSSSASDKYSREHCDRDEYDDRRSTDEYNYRYSSDVDDNVSSEGTHQAIKSDQDEDMMDVENCRHRSRKSSTKNIKNQASTDESDSSMSETSDADSQNNHRKTSTDEHSVEENDVDAEGYYVSNESDRPPSQLSGSSVTEVANNARHDLVTQNEEKSDHSSQLSDEDSRCRREMRPDDNLDNQPDLNQDKKRFNYRSDGAHDSDSSSDTSYTDRRKHKSSRRQSPQSRDISPLSSVVISSSPHLPSYHPAIQGCRNVDEFICMNRIEEGTYGVVYRARDKHTKEVVALKRLKMENEKEGFPITSLREINTLLRSQHENIVTVREIVVGSNMDKIYIVMDYVEHDLKSLMVTMRQKGQALMCGEIKCLMLQLLRAVRHLHDNWVLHRDIKTSNILLSHRGILKLGDFGLAREYGSPLKCYTQVVVTLWYRAPELLLGVKQYSCPIDMWSVGCVFGELLRMEPLLTGKSETDQIDKIFHLLGSPTESVWPDHKELPAFRKVNFTEYTSGQLSQKFAAFLSETGMHLLSQLIAYDPSRRITADEALCHAYFDEHPKPIDPSMFPTWPAKSERTRKSGNSPKPPSGRKNIGDEDVRFQLASNVATNTGFSLKF